MFRVDKISETSSLNEVPLFEVQGQWQLSKLERRKANGRPSQVGVKAAVSSIQPNWLRLLVIQYGKH